MKGRRLPDTPVDKLPADWQAGDYWKCMLADKFGTRPIKVVGHESNLTGTMWRVVTPLGQLGTLSKHTVREHDDETISVRPGDGSSNSILIHDHRGSWHGYIEHGEWQEI